ncbi:hypothetical protein E1200_04865 [Actinomadura sp. GC306]|uniref:hypothetical protein n=1 Tax=Actinomadura sp. GC306 TaxID=2530367 RepID=UPI001053A7B7|nr:hypothetical protein [Actinomadura sp. GC306]TDC70570.1 hypothetical protein E1200_04865 [Actinomadura sp. GC306]
MSDYTPAPAAAGNDDETVQLAANLYEHVRQLNYATAGPPSLTQPSTAYAILGNLSAATYGLNQALDQVNRFFLRELQAGRLGHDHGEDLTDVLSRHGQALADARHHTQALCTALNEAHAAINAVHSRPSQRESAFTTQRWASDQDAGVAAAAEDFPRPISDFTFIERPPTSEQHSPIRFRHTNTPEA